MSGKNSKASLDLKYPGFQSELFDLDASDVKKVLDTFKQLRGMTLNVVFRDQASDGMLAEGLKMRGMP